MKWVDLKNLSVKELEEILAEKRTEARNLRFDLRNLKHVHKIGAAKETIARVLTLLKQRAIKI